jgi:VWFA-related protein
MLWRTPVCLLFLSLPAAAQTNLQFHAETNVVQVPVSVLDKNGHEVEGLSAADFQVFDNGVQQPVTLDVFDTGVARISLVIAVQSSSGSTPALTKIRTIGGMIQPLVVGARGEAALVTFDKEVKWVQDFTPDAALFQTAVTNLKPNWSQQGRMLDAVMEATDRLKDREGRKILLIVSESRDRGSKAKFAEALEAVERAGIEIFGAHYSAYATAFTVRPEDLPDTHTTPITDSAGPPPPPTTNVPALLSELGRFAKTNVIQALTNATGGSDFPFSRQRGVQNAIEALGVEVHSQYLLSFPRHSVNKDESIHRIDVSVLNRPELRIRSRRAW